MFPTKLKIVTAAILAAGVLAGGGGFTHSALAAPVPAARKVPKELLEKLRDAAMQAYARKLTMYQAGIGSVSPLLGWSERWLEAELALSQKKADDILALKAHLKRTREVERITIAYVKALMVRQADADAATYERINAEIRIFQATGKIPPPPVYDKPVPIPKFLEFGTVKEQDEAARKEAVEQKKRRLRRENKQPPQRDTKEVAPAKDRKELLQQRRVAAWRVNEGRKRDIIMYGPAEIFPRDLLGWSERLLEADLALRDMKEDRLAALKAHLARTREVERLAISYAKTGLGMQSDADAATYERIQADIRYFQATGEVPPPPPEVKIEGAAEEELTPPVGIKGERKPDK